MARFGKGRVRNFTQRRALNKKHDFADPDVWTGGYYELVIWLGLPSEARIGEALSSIWNSPLLDGPYRYRDREPDDQPRIPPVEDHLFGLARIRDHWLPCGAYIVRKEDESGARVGDFFSLYIPLSGLSTVYDVGAYPFGSIDAAKRWRPEVDAWFLQLLRGLNRPFEFQLGVIGFEVNLTSANAPGLLRSASENDERYEGLIIPAGAGLKWRSPTSYKW